MTCLKCGGLVVSGDEPGETRCVICSRRTYAPWEESVVRERTRLKCAEKWCRDEVMPGSTRCRRHKAKDVRLDMMNDLRALELRLSVDLGIVRKVIHGLESLS